MNSYIAFIEDALERQRRARHFHVAFAVFTVVVGVVLIAVVQWVPGASSSALSKLLLTLGGTFVSSLASLPLREFFRRSDRLAALRFLLQGFRSLLDGTQDSVGGQEEELKSRFWKLVDAGLEA